LIWFIPKVLKVKLGVFKTVKLSVNTLNSEVKKEPFSIENKGDIIENNSKWG